MFAVLLALPLALVAGTMAPEWLGVAGGHWQQGFLLLVPAGVVLALRLGRKGWPRYGMVMGIPAGAGWYLPWIARKLPDRWGVVLAWSLTAGAMGLIPLLLAIKLMWSRIDDDDFAFGAMAVFYGITCAANRGWWEAGTIRREDFFRRWSVYFRKWLDPRALPWLLAFTICGLTIGGMRTQYDVLHGESLSVVLKPISYAWPASLTAAALAGLAAAWRKRSVANGAYVLGCFVVAGMMILSLATMARYRLEADAGGLSVRMGLFRGVDLPRERLLRVETEFIRSRRSVSPYLVLVTVDGKRHRLRRLPMGYVLRAWLRDEWKVPVEERW